MSENQGKTAGGKLRRMLGLGFASGITVAIIGFAIGVSVEGWPPEHFTSLDQIGVVTRSGIEAGVIYGFVVMLYVLISRV